MSTADFYNCSPYDVQLAIEGFNEHAEYNFYLQQTAVSNAIGSWFGKKGFKPVNPFEKEKEPGVKPSTVEQKEETLTYLENKFNIR